jgi:hypothetical protein
MKGPLPLATACRFRYRGYLQNNGVRELVFEDVAEETNKHPVVVDVDVRLLLKHNVHFQDAPRLCIQLLSGNPVTVEASAGATIRVCVSDDDLADLLAKTEEGTGAKKRV